MLAKMAFNRKPRTYEEWFKIFERVDKSIHNLLPDVPRKQGESDKDHQSRVDRVHKHIKNDWKKFMEFIRLVGTTENMQYVDSKGEIHSRVQPLPENIIDYLNRVQTGGDCGHMLCLGEEEDQETHDDYFDILLKCLRRFASEYLKDDEGDPDWRVHFLTDFDTDPGVWKKLQDPCTWAELLESSVFNAVYGGALPRGLAVFCAMLRDFVHKGNGDGVLEFMKDSPPEYLAAAIRITNKKNQDIQALLGATRLSEYLDAWAKAIAAGKGDILYHSYPGYTQEDIEACQAGIGELKMMLAERFGDTPW